MSTKMLIDAAHPEETRVVVLRDGKVEEFDFEAASRRQLRGNIYLAKVTRVEPSLQAAFVDYGGNRHGFLAFSEIHPDYYQIPYADRQALLAEEERAEHEAADSEDRRADQPAAADPEPETNGNGETAGGSVEEIATAGEESVESVGGDDALEEVPVRRAKQRRTYKIQEVIKKRQILLVQVVKEERGNKGAALTTYLSLAGRYSVLMPNTARGGGISRKIVNSTDRKRLKEIAGDLDVPEGMGVILRTAGAARTRTEIKRDFEYLLRLWENVRELTLQSVAPTLVYEEGSLVKRAIRDLYTKDIDQVLVAGDDAYREAKDFMRMLMPSHAKNIQPYKEPEPIFSKHRIEAQLDAMFSPQVTLKSGGYVVLNQTEALVSIDVNSGRSTREHNIEDTALKTNLEASDEISRQLRLRDLAGLIVIDFIDMEEKRNNRLVERRLKDALRHDRARIQVGRISHFGLMEMSRQRIRSGVLESTMQPCPHCEGTGRVRSVESVTLHLLRTIENELLKGRPTDLTLRTRTEVALYVLNQKRTHLRELEERFSVIIVIEADDSVAGANFTIERGEPARPAERGAAVRPISVEPEQVDEPVEEEEEEEEEGAEETPARRAEEDGNGRRRRRRRRRRGAGGEAHAPEHAGEGDEEPSAAAEQAELAERAGDGERDDDAHGAAGRRRRRGRRGGRRHRGEPESGEVRTESAATPDIAEAEPEALEEAAAPASAEPAPVAAAPEHAEPAAESVEPVEAAAEAPAPRKRRVRKPRAATVEPEVAPEAAPDLTVEAAQAEPEPVVALSSTVDAEAEAMPQAEAEAEEPAKPVPTPDSEPAAAILPEAPVAEQDNEPHEPRRGWWRRRSRAAE